MCCLLLCCALLCCLLLCCALSWFTIVLCAIVVAIVVCYRGLLTWFTIVVRLVSAAWFCFVAAFLAAVRGCDSSSIFVRFTALHFAPTGSREAPIMIDGDGDDDDGGDSENDLNRTNSNHRDNDDSSVEYFTAPESLLRDTSQASSSHGDGEAEAGGDADVPTAVDRRPVVSITLPEPPPPLVQARPPMAGGNHGGGGDAAGLVRSPDPRAYRAGPEATSPGLPSSPAVGMACGLCARSLTVFELQAVDACAVHFLCEDCLRAAVTDAVRGGGVSLTCPVGPCRAPVSEREIRALVDADTFSEYERRCVMSALDADSMIHCPSADCGAVWERADNPPPPVTPHVGDSGGGVGFPDGQHHDGAGPAAEPAVFYTTAGGVRKQMSPEAAAHRRAHRYRCRSCDYVFCAACNASPYHDGFTCAGWEQRNAARKCRFCLAVLAPEAEACAEARCVQLAAIACTKTKVHARVRPFFFRGFCCGLCCCGCCCCGLFMLG